MRERDLPQVPVPVEALLRHHDHDRVRYRRDQGGEDEGIVCSEPSDHEDPRVHAQADGDEDEREEHDIEDHKRRPLGFNRHRGGFSVGRKSHLDRNLSCRGDGRHLPWRLIRVDCRMSSARAYRRRWAWLLALRHLLLNPWCVICFTL